MVELNDIEIRLSEQLLLSVIKKEPNITYKELAKRIDPPIFHRQVGKHIGKISELCAELGLPLISAKVINTYSHKAGDGFYPLFKQLSISTDGLSESELFKRELKRIRECKEWYKLAEYLDLNIELPKQQLLQKEIRILPMSGKFEFPNMSYSKIQEKFFLSRLKEKNGVYNYRENGMSCGTGSLILFQIDNCIIASAELIEIRKFDIPKDGVYKGAYIFDIDSIKIFEPITAVELSKIDNNFKGFSQVKQKIDVSKQDEITHLIISKMQVSIPEEILETEIKKYYEGAKHQITVNAYERNNKARQECIEIHGTTCKICGFESGKVYGEALAGKIHVHHIKPLNEIDDTYEINPETDLIPVCPNCHAILHSKVGGVYSVEEVRKMLK